MSRGASIKDAYAWIQILVRLLMRAFFRRVEVAGLNNVPEDGGGLLVAWHPNGLIDPGLIMSQFNRRVVFGARHGLFSYPGLGSLLRALGTVPIYRAMDAKGKKADPEARRAANRKSLEALGRQIVGGRYSALFPEGDSHDESDVQDFKTGAARLYYGARRLVEGDDPEPVIIPVGLYYDDKEVFRSSALVVFYPPLQLPKELDVTPDADPDSPQVHALCKELTDYLEVELREATFATDSWRMHHLIRRARRLIVAERAARSGAKFESETLGERIVAFAKIRQGYKFFADNDPEGNAELEKEVEDYDADLRALGLQDEHLDHGPGFPTWFAVLLGLQMIGVFVFLPVLVFFGYLVNLPTAGMVVAGARVMAKKKKDEATLKLLLGAVLFPLTWVSVGVLAGLGVWELHLLFPRVPDTPVLSGVSVALLGAVGGAAGIRYWRFAREVARSVRVRLTRQRFRLSVARLRQRRRALHDRLMEVAAMADVPTKSSPSASRTSP